MKKYRVTLTELERQELKILIASGKYKNTKQKRAQIYWQQMKVREAKR